MSEIMSEKELLNETVSFIKHRIVGIPQLSSCTPLQQPQVLKVMQSPFFGAVAPIMPILSVPLAGVGVASGVIKNVTGAGDADQNRLYELDKQIQFIDNERESGIGGTFNVVALRQDRGVVDLLIKADITYTPGYGSRTDTGEMRSCYQDFVRFDIAPRKDDIRKDDISVWDIVQNAVVPKTNNNEVDYSVTTGWNATFGLSGTASATPSVSPNASVNYSFQASSTTKTKDFNIQRETGLAKKYISWVSYMKNCYENNNASVYDVANPYSLVNATVFTRWLRSVPDVAKSDFSLQYQSAYYMSKENFEYNFEKTFTFDFFTIQRFIHAEIVDRVGPPWARQGGSAAMYPFYLVTHGVIAVNFAQKTVILESLENVIYKLSEIMDPNSDINHLLHNVSL